MSQDETRITLRTKLEKTAQKASNGDFTTVEYVDGKPEFRKPKKLGGAKKIWVEGFKARTVRGKVHQPIAPLQSFVYMPRFGIAGDRPDVVRILQDAGLREFADRLDRYTITYQQWTDFVAERGDAEIYVDSRVNKDGHITSQGTSRHFSDFWETTERTPGIRQKALSYQETMDNLLNTVDRIQGFLGTRSKTTHRSPRRKDKKVSPKKVQRSPAENLRSHVTHSLSAGKVYDVTDLRENGTGGRSTKVSKSQRTRVEIEKGVVVSVSEKKNTAIVGATNYWRLVHGADLPNRVKEALANKLKELTTSKTDNKTKKSVTQQKSDEEVVNSLNSAPGFVPKTSSRTGSPVRKQTPAKGASKNGTGSLLSRYRR